MSEKKRSRVCHSELPQEERDRINARRRFLQLQKKEMENSLFPVSVEDDETTTTSMSSYSVGDTSGTTNDTKKKKISNLCSVQPEQIGKMHTM